MSRVACSLALQQFGYRLLIKQTNELYTLSITFVLNSSRFSPLFLYPNNFYCFFYLSRLICLVFFLIRKGKDFIEVRKGYIKIQNEVEQASHLEHTFQKKLECETFC